MHILVADDQGFWRRALEESLLQQGFRVTCVEDGAKAWQALQAQPDISLVITDWEMPGMSGPELCTRVRSLEKNYVPVILMTSRTAPEDLVAALDAGADAFVKKPFDEPELLAQIRVASRIVALETRLAQRIDEVERAVAHIERDLEHAARVQRSLMPEGPPGVPGMRFAWFYQSCQQIGGDLFNVFRLSEDHVGIHVLDVSGHGTSAALHSVSVGHVLHPQPQQGGILKRIPPDGGAWSLTQPGEVAAELNRRFPLIERSGHYFTFLYGILELSTRRFHYARAGHPGPIHVSATGARWLERGGGVPIGVSEDARFPENAITLAAGDSLILFTDGVPEASDAEGEQLGMDRVLELAGAGRDGGVRASVDRLRAGIAEHCKHASQRDDVTIVGFELD